MDYMGYIHKHKNISSINPFKKRQAKRRTQRGVGKILEKQASGCCRPTSNLFSHVRHFPNPFNYIEGCYFNFTGRVWGEGVLEKLLTHSLHENNIFRIPLQCRLYIIFLKSLFGIVISAENND